MKSIVVLFLFAASFYATAQAPSSTNISGDAAIKLAKHLQEKVYLQTDKPYYYPGEKIWFSAFMNYRSPGLDDTLSRTLYVEIISPQRGSIVSSIVRIDRGRAEGSVNIPAISPAGSYTLRAYTNWMRNYGPNSFFYKSIPVLEQYDRAAIKTIEKPDAAGPVTINFDKPDYKPGDSVKMTLAMSSAEIAAHVSLGISITDEFLVAPITGGKSIVTDFAIPEELPAGMLPKFRYPVEEGLAFAGIFANQKGVPQKTDKLVIVQEHLTNVYTIKTDQTGRFFFRDLNFYDSAHFAVQSRKGTVAIEPREEPGFATSLPHFDVPVEPAEKAQRPLPFDTSKVIVLKTAEVFGERLSSTTLHNSDFYVSAETLKTYPNLTFAIAAKMILFRMTYSNGHYFLVYSRGLATREPMLYIDNYPAYLASSSGETVGDRINNMDINTVDHIEANSSITAGLGASSLWGALYIYLKKGDPYFKALPGFAIRGYDAPRSFASFMSKWNTNVIPSTVYWNPKVDLTSKQREMMLPFKGPTTPGKYRVVAEGIDGKGVPFRSEWRIAVD